MARGPERSQRRGSLLAEKVELHQGLPIIWDRINQVLKDSGFASRFHQELQGWWREILRKAIYRGIGINPQVKKRHK